MIALPAWAGHLLRRAGNAFAASGFGGIVGFAGAILIALLLERGSIEGNSVFFLVLLLLLGVIAGIALGWIPVLVAGSLLNHCGASKLAHGLTAGALGILGGIALNGANDLPATDPLNFMWTVPAALVAILTFRHLENEACNA